MNVPWDIDDVAKFIYPLLLEVGAIEAKSATEGEACLNCTGALMDGTQTGSQGARIRCARIGSGRSALSPKGRAGTKLNQKEKAKKP